MAKRQKIAYNGNELTNNLKRSTGKGVDAFFPEPSPAPAEQLTESVALPAKHEETAATADASSTDAAQSAQVDEQTHAHTDARMHAPMHESEHIDTDAEADANLHGHTDAQVDARTHARVPTDPLAEKAQEEGVDIAEIRRRVSAKRHLSSFTFRFRANELEALDLVMDELNQDDERKVSKNDAVRTALNWLLADYKQRKDDSILARVLTDT